MATRSGIRQRFCNDERRLNSKFAYETMELIGRVSSMSWNSPDYRRITSVELELSVAITNNNIVLSFSKTQAWNKLRNDDKHFIATCSPTFFFFFGHSLTFFRRPVTARDKTSNPATSFTRWPTKDREDKTSSVISSLAICRWNEQKAFDFPTPFPHFSNLRSRESFIYNQLDRNPNNFPHRDYYYEHLGSLC